MAIAEEIPRRLHVGNGTRGPFSLSVDGAPISFSDVTEIVVTRYDSDGVGTLQIAGTHYDLSAETALPDMGDPARLVATATLTFKLAQPVLAADEHLLIERSTAAGQALVLTQSGGFESLANERNLDVIVRVMQELKNKLARVFTINALDSDGAIEAPPVEERAGKILSFNEDGDLIAIDPPEDGATGATGPQGATGATGPPGTGDVLGPATNADNGFPTWDGANSKTLKDISAAQFRTNLGLGSAALLASSAVFQVSNNLSEGNASTMRSNLGLGSAALLASSAVFQVSNNLSEGNASTMRSNLSVPDLASDAEARAGSSTTKALTPSNLVSRARFRAHKNGTDQTGIADLTATKVTCGTEVYDVGSHFASNAWTPPANVPVHLGGAVSVSGMANNSIAIAYIYKNGAVFQAGAGITAWVGIATCVVSAQDVPNGTDYYELYVTGTDFTTTGTAKGTTYETMFWGHQA